jgi:DNA-binding transcriptional MocR family regulator
VARVEGGQLMGIRWVSHVLQRLAVALWSDRATPALLRKDEETYSNRRDALIGALARYGIAAHGRSGMNVWIPVKEEATVVQALLQAGWAVTAGERFRLKTPPGVRVTISTLERAEAEKLAADVARALGVRGLTAMA